MPFNAGMGKVDSGIVDNGDNLPSLEEFDDYDDTEIDGAEDNFEEGNEVDDTESETLSDDESETLSDEDHAALMDDTSAVRDTVTKVSTMSFGMWHIDI
jgi:hypothetical protein